MEHISVVMMVVDAWEVTLFREKRLADVLRHNNNAFTSVENSVVKDLYPGSS